MQLLISISLHHSQSDTIEIFNLKYSICIFSIRFRRREKFQWKRLNIPLVLVLKLLNWKLLSENYLHLAK